MVRLAYYAEIPAVIFDVQRVGPSTGMPTRTQQCDITSAAYASHGDTRHVLLFPADPSECFDMALQAFDLSERLQTPVIVLSDLDIGMNDWMIKEIQWDDTSWRTLPGVHSRGAFFVRGSGHNKFGGYTEKSDEYQEVLDRLRAKSNTACTLVPPPVLETGGDIGTQKDWAVLSVGSCHGAIIEARDRLAEEQIAFDYMRVKAFPFPDSVNAFISNYEKVFVIEQNRDSQLRQLLINEFDINPARLVPVLSYDGMPVGSDFIVEKLKEDLSNQAAVNAG